MATTVNRGYPIPDPALAIHPATRDLAVAIDADIATFGSVGTGTTFTFDSTNLWDNGVAISRTGYTQFSPFHRAVFRTSATSATVGVYLNNSSPGTLYASVRVNGQYYSSFLGTTTGAHTVVVSLPAGMKQVEFIGSMQEVPTTSPLGLYLTGVTFNELATILPPDNRGRIVVIGDSIANGGGAAIQSKSAWTILLRQIMPNYSVVVHGLSGAKLMSYVTDSTTATAFAATVAAMQPEIIWIAMGVNDYQFGTDNNTFKANYTLTVDALHAAIPNARIFAQTPISKAAEGINAASNVLFDFRAVITSLSLDRGSWLYVIDGAAILNIDERASESGLYIHPNEAGHMWYARYVRDALLAYPTSDTVHDSLAVTEPVSFVNTANATVALNGIQRNGGTNNTADSGGSSSRGIYSDHWWIRFTIVEVNTLRYVGVSSTNTGTTVASLLYAFAPTATGNAPTGLGISEAGTDRTTSDWMGYVADDILQIRCEKGIVYYELSRFGFPPMVTYKSTVPVTQSMYPLYVKVVCWGAASTAVNVIMHGAIH